MKTMTKIATSLPKYLFWDMDMDKLDAENDADIIIPRALYMTTNESFKKDIKKLEKIYNKETIIQYLQITKELISNNMCTLVANYYNIEPFKRFYN